jgi:hypothetical protein
LKTEHVEYIGRTVAQLRRIRSVHLHVAVAVNVHDDDDDDDGDDDYVSQR